MRILTPSESLEGKVNHLKEITGRPVYITHDSHPKDLRTLLRPHRINTKPGRDAK